MRRDGFRMTSMREVSDSVLPASVLSTDSDAVPSVDALTDPVEVVPPVVIVGERVGARK